MIIDERVLQSGWVPDDIVHRNTEKNALRDELRPAIDEDPIRPENIFLDGPSGSGKTCLAKFSLDRLERHGIVTQYVNCWNRQSRHRILEALVEGLGRGHEIKPDTAHHELRRIVEETDVDPYVVVLDECDKASDRDLVQHLVSLQHVVCIFVSIDRQHYLSRVDPRLKTRLRDTVHIPFDAYDVSDLVAILQARADAGLQGGVGQYGNIMPSQLEEIAERAQGNAHDALSILRRAAKAADRNGGSQIRTAHIDAVEEDAKAEVRQKAVSRLDPHPRAVYEVLHEADDWIAMQDLVDRYEDVVTETSLVDGEPRSRRRVQDYVQDLIDYNLCQDNGRDGPALRYRAVESRPS